MSRTFKVGGVEALICGCTAIKRSWLTGLNDEPIRIYFQREGSKMKLLFITTAAAVLLAAGGNAQSSSWLGSLKSWLRPSRQTRPQNGAPPQNFPQASQPFPSVQQQGQQGFQVKVNLDSLSRTRSRSRRGRRRWRCCKSWPLPPFRKNTGIWM